MEDPLAARLERVRSFSESVKRRAGLYSEISKLDGKAMADSLGDVQRAPAPGKKLQKVGFIMLWVPEPTMVTAAIGGPMIIAGKYLEKKYNSATICDVGRETADTISCIDDFKSTLHRP